MIFLRYVYQYNGQIVEISATCEEYYRYYNWDGDQWRDYLVDNYRYSSSQIYDAGYDLEKNSGIGQTQFINLNAQVELLIILHYLTSIVIGMALEFLAHPSLTIDINC